MLTLAKFVRTLCLCPVVLLLLLLSGAVSAFTSSSEPSDSAADAIFTRVVSVRTSGGPTCLAGAAAATLPCLFAARPVDLTLTVENMLHHQLQVALTTQAPDPGDLSAGALPPPPLHCDPAKMLRPQLVDAAGITYKAQLTMRGNQHGVLPLPHGHLYFCVNSSRDSWLHQGPDIKILVKSLNESADTGNVAAAVVLGVRPEGDRTSTDGNGLVGIPADVHATVRLFGLNFVADTMVRFTRHSAWRWDSCDEFESSKGFQVEFTDLSDHSAVVHPHLAAPEGSDEVYYLCVKETTQEGRAVRWVHQGSDSWLTVQAQGRLLPLWLQILICVILLTLSGLFSGLNLGLMALDRTDLKIIENTGSDNEKKYAKAISPIRKLGNYLLCTLLLGNVLVNSSLTILLDDLTSGLVAVVGSTLGIVIFGEIIPQAICSRHGLAIGAHTVWITKFFMLVTFPLSFPISKLLDLILGEEIGNVYNRERLKELIKVTHEYHDLQKDEVNIISGALELTRKTVADVMTQLDDVYMVPYDAVLDFATVSDIIKQGYSRVPVYEAPERSSIVALLNIKDLAFVDPDDNSPLKTVCQFYNHPINYVFEDTTLADMLDEFKKGQSHMAFVQRVNTTEDRDPFYEVIGVVTLEDVIEEIIQSEIIDETDVVTDNRHRLKRKEAHLKQDFSVFAQQSEDQRVQISPQMALATFQYLSTAVEPFRPNLVTETVLRRLMRQNVFFNLKIRNADAHLNAPTSFIYQAGKPADYFVLILEGRAQVTIGKECLVFECGPFTYFGVQALIQLTPQGDAPTALPVSAPGSLPSSNAVSPPGGCTLGGGGGLGEGKVAPPAYLAGASFVPDYTVQAQHDVLYMAVKRSQYQAALRATLIERQNKLDPNAEDPFKQVLEKFHSDSIERLAGSLRRTPMTSARSSDRSIAELPGLTSGGSGSRSGSMPSPLANRNATHAPGNSNLDCGGAQPDPGGGGGGGGVQQVSHHTAMLPPRSGPDVIRARRESSPAAPFTWNVERSGYGGGGDNNSGATTNWGDSSDVRHLGLSLPVNGSNRVERSPIGDCRPTLNGQILPTSNV